MPAPVRLKLEGDRVSIPARFTDRIQWLRGEAPIKAWLLLLEVGRYKLVPEEEVQRSPLLRGVLERLLEPDLHSSFDPVEVEGAESVALAARLIATTASPPGPSWRVILPQQALDLMALPERPSHVFLFISLGHLEFWSDDLVRRSVGVPLAAALS